ncbi:SPJ_0845 family protein [Lactobacillus psittaci]|nr:SPJ_0845 family protein [Lactobacillus psittaci]
MGLTFKRSDELEKMLDKFAVIPDDPKKGGKGSKGKADKEQKPENDK